MNYREEIIEYKASAIKKFEKHLIELEENVLSDENLKDVEASELYTAYQIKTLKLIEGKLKIDNEFLKNINITYLEKYKDLDPKQFTMLQGRIIDNHKEIISELKANYEFSSNSSREKIKYEIASIKEDSDIVIEEENAEEFFPEKMHILNFNFIVMLVLMSVIIALICYYNFM